MMPARASSNSSSRLGFAWSVGRIAYTHRAVVLLQQLIQRERKVADASACRVVDGVGNRQCYSDKADLTHPFDPNGVNTRVRPVDEEHLDCADIRRHQI